MDLQTFRHHLHDIDVRASNPINLFDCDARQLNERLFAYTYDGLVSCIVQFNNNGSVDEWQEMLEDNFDPAIKPHFHGADIEAWKQFSVENTTEPQGA